MRRLIVCGAVKGSPGVTTWALALAAAWPLDRDGGVRPVVVEADADGGDLALRFALPYDPGVLDVAAMAGRERPGSVLGAAQELPFGVRAVVAPAAAEGCVEAVRVLARDKGTVLRGQEDELGTVIVDAGRLGESGMELLAAADEAVLVCRGGVHDLVHAAARCEAVGEAAKDFHLVVVGPCGYPVEEITGAVSVGKVHRVPWDARGAAGLTGRCGVARSGGRGLRGWRTPPLLSAAARWAGAVSGLDDRTGLKQLPTALPQRALTESTRAALDAGTNVGGERW